LGANIILDFNSRAWAGEHSFRRSEFAATIAASLATHLATRGLDVGLVSNGVDAADVLNTEPISVEAVNRDEARKLMEQARTTDRLRPVEVRVSKGGESIMSIMEALARISLSEGLDLADVIRQEYIGWPREATAALIVPDADEALFREIARLKSTGFSVLVLVVDNPRGAGRVLSGLASLHIAGLHLRQESDLHNIVL
jgi:hypothetical protein